MGEYANYRGDRVKIGTCEDMLYLRADQAHLVKAISGNVDPMKDTDGIRFRFPWPDEDGIEPGEFDEPDRSLEVSFPAPSEIDHHDIVFAGTYPANTDHLRVMLPCPLSGKEEAEKIRVTGLLRQSLVQQRFWNGHLVAVCQCACGARYRLPTLEDAQPLIDALINYDPNPQNEFDVERQSYRLEVARRVLAGYTNDVNEAVAS